MRTLTTGEIILHLGVLVTPAFIEKMGLEPAEMQKGRPRWNATDVPTLCDNMAGHFSELAKKKISVEDKPKAPPKEKKVKAAATPTAAAKAESAYDIDDL